MATGSEVKTSTPLNTELKLQINQNLYEKGIITKEIYELAKLKIVSHT